MAVEGIVQSVSDRGASGSVLTFFANTNPKKVQDCPPTPTTLEKSED